MYRINTAAFFTSLHTLLPQYMEVINKYFGSLTQKQVEQFTSIKDLYVEWNQKINIISRKDMDNFYVHHVLHSLAIAAQFDFPDGYEVMDLGTGGGFPGIPLAIFFPDVRFHLVDSVNKKLKVVETVSQTIGLTNVSTEHTRAEDIKNKAFDVVVSRAVAPLKDLWQWSKPLLKINTRLAIANGLVCLKGGELSNEISESAARPKVCAIDTIFEEKFFQENYLLFVRS